MTLSIVPAHRFVRRLPCREHQGDSIRVAVHDIQPNQPDMERCFRWHEDVQPKIAADAARPDRRWNWAVMIPALLFAGARRRRPKLLQIVVGAEEVPAAMVAMLEEERWPEGGLPAAYLWYVSTAPRHCVRVRTEAGRVGSPTMVGMAAIDAALTISVSGISGGRLWLHADPAGGPELLSWYGLDACATRIPAETFPNLPGDVVRGDRRNDGRYFAFTPETAAWGRARLNRLRS